MTDVFNAKVANRHEERARKSLAKLGLVEVPQINRVTLKIQGQVFGMSKPAVVTLPGSDLYIVFGEPKQDSLMSRLGNMQGGMGQNMMDPSMMEGMMGDMGAAMPMQQQEEEADDGEPEDEEGLDAEEIQSIIDQTGASRNKAVKTLKRTGTVVDAILELQ